MAGLPHFLTPMAQDFLEWLLYILHENAFIDFSALCSKQHETLTWVKGITVTSWWARWRLKSPATRLFTPPFIQIKENIKALRHWPLCGEFTGDRWIPLHKGPVTRKMFPFDDVIMEIMHPLIPIESPELTWRSSSHKWYLQIPDLPLNCSELT